MRSVLIFTNRAKFKFAASFRIVVTDMCATVDPEILEDMAQEAPIGRNGTPEDVAQAMAYLADATFVTGQVLPVNGGYVL